MTPKEAWQLLTIASARDGRTVDKAVATVWASDLMDTTRHCCGSRSTPLPGISGLVDACACDSSCGAYS